ncbi:Autoinducer binding domain-containing protein [Thiothrix eikelboomii]|uniref:Autoinducer binding domain-containing protein n=1 Tax=Thiothrix eikelboomii TaxID=92487 RepID=A0A1T4VSX8_9GAMM|nr:autoinducer binding domain-containing protein [Thiothrix eikelboomii]SKA67611.1 Autoinducer binding domain-containing protein [Thiothrix eikelboomii]
MDSFDWVDHYLSELGAAASLEARFQLYGEYIKQLGFDGATYIFAPRIQYEIMPHLPGIFLYTESYPLDFLDHYRRDRLDRQDFTIRKVLNGETASMDWREHELSGELSAAEVSLIQLARENYGIRNAISIPTMLDARGAAGVSIISSKADGDFQQLKQEKMTRLVGITRLFHASNSLDSDWSLHFTLSVFKSLSATEMSILNYKATGKPLKNINDYLDVKYSYATNVVSTLLKKLGNTNSDQLMYLFGLLNSLNNLPPKKPPESM